MSAPKGELPEEGLALWLTDWKTFIDDSWTGRRLIATIGGALAGHLDFVVHPNGQAVQVWELDVKPGFQRRGLAGLLMDALYAAHPTVWINHGTRTDEGARWWNGYREPDVRRNIHNRPFDEWASYFDAVQVAADKAELVHLNGKYGLDGHHDDVYRYGQRLEEEAGRYVATYQPPPVVRPDAAAQPLNGAARLFLPAELHAYVHDGSQDAAGRAAALLEYLGHGNLPRSPWNITHRAAFEDAHHEELFVPSDRPATHVVFTICTPAGGDLPPYDTRPTSVDFASLCDIPVDVHGMSWRQARQPHLAHTATLTPPFQAAVAPYSWKYASTGYRARYDEAGFSRTPGESVAGTEVPYADRATEIQTMADRLIGALAERTPKPQPGPSAKPSAPAAHEHEQQAPFRPMPGPGR